MKIDDITVIIPSYKPSQELIGVVFKLSEEFERIVVVDDGGGKEYASIFDTIKKFNGVEVVTHISNQGKGRALKTAFNWCLLNDKVDKGIITVDGDGQHKVEDVIRIAEEMREYPDSVILGCRDFSTKNIPFRSRFGNNISRVVYRWACGLSIEDTQTGLRGIPAKYVPMCLKIGGEKYDYETNMLLAFKDNGVDFSEIKIQTIYEGKNENSHFNPVRDSFLIYAVIIKYSLSSLITALVDYLSFSILILYLSILPATYGARFIAGLLNFYLNKRMVFNNKGNTFVQFAKYVALVVLSGTLSGLMITRISGLFPRLSLLVIKIPVEAFLYLFNYLIQRTVIFREKK